MDNREPIDRIKALISSLPRGDVKLAHRYLNSRDFESLQLLVDSSLVRVKKGLSKESPKEEYLKADLGEMRKLKSEKILTVRLLSCQSRRMSMKISVVKNTIKII